MMDPEVAYEDLETALNNRNWPNVIRLIDELIQWMGDNVGKIPNSFRYLDPEPVGNMYKIKQKISSFNTFLKRVRDENDTDDSEYDDIAGGFGDLGQRAKAKIRY